MTTDRDRPRRARPFRSFDLGASRFIRRSSFVLRHSGPAARRSSLLALLAVLPFVGGCGLLFGGSSPDKANIQLRKDKQDLEAQVATLKERSSADERRIAGLQADRPTVPTLPPERLAKLFVTHGLKLGRLTGGWDRDARAPGDEGVAVYVAPTDEDGQVLKMAGAFTVEAVDLTNPGKPVSVGVWTFDVAAARKLWRGSFLDNGYVLECPWQGAPPAHAGLTLRVTFLDELTQTPYTVQQPISVTLPPAAATQPAATRPAVATP
ncbi:MAG TPA: hypothetical protein VF796_21005 [Humisphaera sp.]